MIEKAFDEQQIQIKLDDYFKLAHDQWFKEVDNFISSDWKGAMKQVIQLIKQN